MTTVETARVGDWGSTITGRSFWPQDFRSGDFNILDIAHALSNICRFAGHTRAFYSVAEHSVHVSHLCDGQDALWGLLHDASEAYLGDIARPLKTAPGMRGYKMLERACMDAICRQFGLPYETPESVKRADSTMLATEARDLMPPTAVEKWVLVEPASLAVSLDAPWTPEKARRRFLDRFHQLKNGVPPMEAYAPTPR